jgi:hypothetical protein
MAAPAPESVIANIVTGESMILGTIRLPHTAVGTVTYHFRFLELLNNPRLGGMQSDRLRDSLALTDVYVLPKQGPKISVAQELFVRPESIVCAYEYEGERRPADTVKYDTNLYQKPERVVIVTVNGWRLDATFIGGVSALAAPAQKRFLPLLDVSLSHSDQPGTHLSVPFVALNNGAISAFTRAVAESD